jgi:small subunit ribosomal protein S2
MNKILLSQLLKMGTHFGNKTEEWNPKMFLYIYAESHGIHILDVQQTCQLLTEACALVKIAAQNKKKFLFVGTEPRISEILAQEAKKCNSFYINQRWLGGMLTNWKTIKVRIKRLKTLEQQYKKGIFDLFPKKDAAIIKNELKKLKKYLSGIKNMRRIPDIIIVIDQQRELTAIKEAMSLNIPVISMLDSDCNPDLCNIGIPGNDNSQKSVKLILQMLGKSILKGQSMLVNIPNKKNTKRK